MQIISYSRYQLLTETSETHKSVYISSMTTNICSYEGCMVRRLPCSSIAFFAIPNDSRRQEWILNSGNRDLYKLNIKQRRFLCEEHFHSKDIRSQFNRKILRKDALPIPHKSVSKSITNAVSSTFEEHSLKNRDSKLIDQESSVENNSELLIEYDFAETEKPEMKPNSEDISDCTEFLDNEIESEPTKGDSRYSVLCMDVVDKDEVNINMEEPIESHENNVLDSDDIFGQGSTKAKYAFRHNVPKVNDHDPKKTTINSINGIEEDRNFALSLVGYFQRLSHEKKVVAKLKILSYLTALELGTNLEL